jgi:hypothetical protein
MSGGVKNSIKQGEIKTMNLDFSEWISHLNTANATSYESLHPSTWDALCPSIHAGFKTRLGSDSQNAEVYLYNPFGNLFTDSVDSVKFALKVIPVTVSHSLIRKELERSIKLSKHKFYPSVYAVGKCPIETFHSSSKFKQATEAYYIVFELLWCDLQQFIRNQQPTVKQLKSIIKDVLKAIMDLNYVQKIFHNDLHLRNVMLRKTDTSFEVVLIDFGQSEDFNEEDHIGLDVLEFLKMMKKELGDNNKYASIVKYVISVIDKIEDVNDVNELIMR